MIVLEDCGEVAIEAHEEINGDGTDAQDQEVDKDSAKNIGTLIKPFQLMLSRKWKYKKKRRELTST